MQKTREREREREDKVVGERREKTYQHGTKSEQREFHYCSVCVCVAWVFKFSRPKRGRKGQFCDDFFWQVYLY